MNIRIVLSTLMSTDNGNVIAGITDVAVDQQLLAMFGNMVTYGVE